MPHDVKMPRLSDNMEAGTIVRWFKQPGDVVRVGEPLAEVETDKADVELESEAEGKMLEIVVAEGTSVPVGGVIARLAAAGEQAADDGAAASREDSPGRDGDAAVATAESPKSKVPPTVRAVGSEGASSSPATTRTAPAPVSRSPGGAVKASPLAWRLAEEAGIPLARLHGSGPGGRILKRDVDAARAKSGGLPAGQIADVEFTASSRARNEVVGGEVSPSDSADAPHVDTASRIEPVSRMRSTIARRMTQAKRDIPHFYVKVAVDMTECMRLRESIKQSGSMPGLTVTHMIVKAVALTLGRHPRVNASWREDGTVALHAQRNIGIAVAVDDGLVVPTLHETEGASLAEIAERAKQLTERARSGKFGGKDLSGSTISISNVGMLDVDELVAVINPPHAAVLAVASVKERPMVRDGRLTVGKTMQATLSCDHRVLNGVEGAAFLEDLKAVLENPVVLLLE